jgi:hypothetical protein
MSLYSLALGTAGETGGGLIAWSDSTMALLRTVGGHSTALLFGTYLAQFAYLLFAGIMLLLTSKTIPTAFALLMAVTVPMIVMTGHVSDAARVVTMTVPFVITLAARVRRRWVDALITAVLGAGWIAYFFAFIAGYTGVSL